MASVIAKVDFARESIDGSPSDAKEMSEGKTEFEPPREVSKIFKRDDLRTDSEFSKEITKKKTLTLMKA